MFAAAVEVEKCFVLHLDLRARTAFLAGYDRSILGGVGVEKRRRERRRRVMPRMAQLSSL
jgi:hypothetical protein